jgi:ABC-type antimicrobial peptide transport system permease subunit
MSTVWLALRADVRRRWRPLLGLALLLGLIGGVALTAAAGARRTDTAYPRLLAWSNASQFDVVPGGTGLTGYYTALAKLPGIAALATEDLYQAVLPGTNDEPATVISSPDGRWGISVDRVKVLAGTLFNPATPGLAMVDQQIASQEHLTPGSVVRVDGIKTNEANGLPPDYSHPIPLTFRITAIVAFPDQIVPTGQDNSAPTMLVSTPFGATRVAPMISDGDEAAIGLRPGQSAAAFQAAAASLAVKYPATAPQPGAPGAINVVSLTDQVTATERAIKPEAVALAVFAALTGLIALAVLGQLLSRQLVLDAAEFAVLRSLGATRATLVALSLARLAAITVTGAVLAVVVAVAASPLMPIGPARLAEPHPGVEVNVAILAAGFAAVALLPLAALAPAARRAASQAGGVLGIAQPAAPGRRSRLAALLGRAGSLSGGTGVRMAFEPGHGRTAVPVRGALVGTLIAVTAVTAAGVFGASLAGLVNTPHAYGENWQEMTDFGFGAVAAQQAFPALPKADPSISQYAAGNYGVVTIAGRSIAAIGLDQLRGGGFLTLLAGQPPTAPGEIALGAQTMSALHLRLGQQVPVVVDHTVTGTAAKPTTMRVTGTVVFAGFSRGGFAPTGLGTGAVVPAAVLSEPSKSSGCTASVCYNFLLLRFRPGTPLPAATAKLTTLLDATGCTPAACVTSADQRPGDIKNDASITGTPLVLGIVLAVLAVGTLAHVLLTGVSRRRRDLALLKTLGFTRAQVQGVVAWQATAFAAVALLIGLPLGVVAGRLAWAGFANAAGVATEATVDVSLVLLAIPVTLVLANLIAAWPGWTAARLRPAVILRAE